MKQEKSIFLMLALSGSVLMVMLVSTLLFVPRVNSLQADITSPTVVMQIPQKEESAQTSDMKLASAEDPEEIIKMIHEYVRKNNPDAAKKLYDELYTVKSTRELPMGGEVDILAAR